MTRLICRLPLRGSVALIENAAAFGLAGSVAASDAPSQVVESSADTLPGRAVVGDLVVAATKVLYEGVTGCHDAHYEIVFIPRIGRSRAFSRPWSASIRLFAYCSVTCRAVGATSSTTRGYAG